MSGVIVSPKVIERTKHIGPQGREYWRGSEVYEKILGYKGYGYFAMDVPKAEEACAAGGIDPSTHIIRRDDQVIEIDGKKSRGREFILSRHGFHTIVRNDDRKKLDDRTRESMNMARVYLAMRSPSQELTPEALELLEDMNRLAFHPELVESNKELQDFISRFGTWHKGDFSAFRNKGCSLFDMTEVQQVRDAMGIKGKDAYGQFDATLLDWCLLRNEIANKNMCDSFAGTKTLIKKCNLQAGAEVRSMVKDVSGDENLPEKLLTTPCMTIQRLKTKYKSRCRDQLPMHMRK